MWAILGLVLLADGLDGLDVIDAIVTNIAALSLPIVALVPRTAPSELEL